MKLHRRGRVQHVSRRFQIAKPREHVMFKTFDA